MRILFISDLHYTHETFHGIYQGLAWSWLLDIVYRTKPDLILSAGDWDKGISREEFEELLREVPVLSIYGNHENMEVLKQLRNPLLENKPVLIEDGEVVEVKGIKISGISGVLSKTGKPKRGVPRKTEEEYIEICKKLRPVNFLLIHEAPAIPEFEGIIKLNPHTKTVLECLKRVKADLILGGHIHETPYTIHLGEFKYLRVDSSQRHRAYGVIDTEERRVEVFIDKKKVKEFEY
ncbi:metallophosphoesterase family protein [Pyrococcus kukulkanii]|uniref:metallophosphoesterase family protein n=1 Tax=Pyrococcus kukulkanii TaxID=1609559 RepID=UPI0035687C3E